MTFGDPGDPLGDGFAFLGQRGQTGVRKPHSRCLALRDQRGKAFGFDRRVRFATRGEVRERCLQPFCIAQHLALGLQQAAGLVLERRVARLRRGEFLCVQRRRRYECSPFAFHKREGAQREPVAREQAGQALAEFECFTLRLARREQGIGPVACSAIDAALLVAEFLRDRFQKVDLRNAAHRGDPGIDQAFAAGNLGALRIACERGGEREREGLAFRMRNQRDAESGGSGGKRTERVVDGNAALADALAKRCGEAVLVARAHAAGNLQLRGGLHQANRLVANGGVGLTQRELPEDRIV